MSYLEKLAVCLLIKNPLDAPVGHSHISVNYFNQIAFLIHTQLRGPPGAHTWRQKRAGANAQTQGHMA